MVSKTVLACLALLASISAIQGTIVAGPKGFGPCVASASYINLKLGLKLDLHGLLGDVLHIVDGVLAGLGGLLSRLLGGGKKTVSVSTDNIPYVDYPQDLPALVEVSLKYLQIYETACQKKFGSRWEKNILIEVYKTIAVKLFLKLGIDIDAYVFLNDALTIKVLKQKVSRCTKNLKTYYSTGPSAGIAASISAYLNIINVAGLGLDLDANVDLGSIGADFDVNIYTNCYQKYIGFQGPLLYNLGYLDVEASINAWVVAYNQVVVNLDVELSQIDVVNTDYKKTSPCGCF